ncbi:MAG: energy-dependent translational throttle protein EttA [Alphaproteobacteria bacterium]|jgi:ATP-binding cassette ChvD family protein|nr:energy-dependent translational throttle protein EttA [Alphaproteobacteria bacterium]
MAQFVLTMKDVKKVFPGGKTILKGLYLSFFEDAKIGILGHNGAGKSTFMKIVAGLDKEYTGEIWVRDGIKVGYLPQEPQLNESLNVKENIMESVKEIQNLVEQFNEVSMKFADVVDDSEMDKLLEIQGQLQNQIDAKDAWDLDRQIDIAMDALRCPSGEASIKNLSGGEKRRIALCKLLLEKPDILLLDEPTNHLDAESVSWLERYLKEYKGMVLVITHDRYFLDNITNWILELERGEGIPYEGNYSSWLLQKQKRLQQEEREESARQKTLKKEYEWVSQSPKARQAKNKARITAYENLLSTENENKAYESSLIIPPGPKLGEIVIEVKNVSKAFENKLLIDDLTFTVPRGAVVGIIGANGAGKTTMFRMLTQKETPDKGNIRIGESVVLGYVDQSRDSLNDNNTVWQEISDGMDVIPIGKRTIPSRAYTAQFNFKGADQQKKIASLSGGERNRVHLAKMLKSGANVLLLDEPTNDLDVETLSALEEAILEYAGCVLVISHDRWFLDRISTHILAFEGDSKVIWNEGNYQDYEEDKIKRLGIDASQPHRIKYKPLS